MKTIKNLEAKEIKNVAVVKGGAETTTLGEISALEETPKPNTSIIGNLWAKGVSAANN